MFGPFKLKKTVGRPYDVDLTDIEPLKRGLSHLGYYRPPSFGFTEMPDDALFEGIERLQADNGLRKDAVMKPNGPTATKLGERLAQKWMAENAGMGAQSEGGDIPGPEELKRLKADWERRKKAIAERLRERDAVSPVEKTQRPKAAWSGLLPSRGREHHHDRNKHQQCPPNAPQPGDPNWKGEGSLWTHCGYESYRGRTGGPKHGHQCVYKKDGKLVSDPECRGTYDYEPPYNEKGEWEVNRVRKHLTEDFLKWILYGN